MQRIGRRQGGCEGIVFGAAQSHEETIGDDGRQQRRDSRARNGPVRFAGGAQMPRGSFGDWVSAAIEHKGSWWPDWFAWIEAQAPRRVPARVPGDGALAPLSEAPGTYVKIKA